MSSEGAAGAILGGIAGFFIPGVGPVLGAQIGYAAGSALGAEGQNAQGPRLSDLRIQSSAYGKDIPIVYGSARMSGNIIWGLPLRETATEEDQGKGGGGSTVTTYTYDATFAVLLCEGPITGIRKIWAYGELIYNLSDDASLETIIASNRAARSFTIYTGSETQEADPLIQADLGAANTQAFRGYAYVVFNRLQLEKYGNRIPELTFEVVGAGQQTVERVASLDVSYQNVDYQSVVVYWDSFSTAYILQMNGGSGVGDGTYTLFKQYVNGKVDTGPTVSAPYGNAIPPMYGHGDQQCYIWRGSVFSARYATFVVYDESFKLTASGQFDTLRDSLTGITFTNSNCEYCIADGVLYFLISGSLSGPTYLAKIRISDAAPIGDASYPEITIINDTTGQMKQGAISITVYENTIYILNNDDTLQAFDLDGAYLSQSSFTPSPAISYERTNHEPSVRVEGSSIYLIEAENVHVIKNGQYGFIGDTQLQFSTGAEQNQGGRLLRNGIVYYYMSNTALATNFYWIFNLFSNSTESVTLSSIQSDICQRSGLAASDINVTALTDNVTGYVIPRNMSGRAASEQLMKAYFYDPADINNKITFVKRGGASVATITEDDLGAHYYGSDFETITYERLQDPELPSEIIIKHIDQNRAYQDGAQRSQRITHPVENISTTELSIVMTATKAKQTAEIWMQNAYTERDKYQFALSRDYIDLNPTDVITVPTGGGNRDLRITKITYAPVMDIEAVADSPYTSDAEAGEGEAIGGNIGLQGPTNLSLLDIPLLRNADNDEGIYLAASGYYDAWTGGQVFTSNNETDGFTSKTSIFNDAVMGTATTALADGSMYDWDRTNTVTIKLTNGDLSSITEDQVVQGNNYFLLGNNGRWEVGQYVDADLISEDTYTLSTLTRGRRGTDSFTGTHEIGDIFIFIGALTLKRIEHAYNALKYYKAATFGTFLDEADTQSLTNSGVSLKPFSPVDVKGSRDGSNNLTITWMRRSRYIAPTFRDLPLFEESQSYEVDIMSGSTVLRTIAVTAQTASYTAAQQTTDGLTPGNSITVRVYQLSAIVGRGYKREALI